MGNSASAENEYYTRAFNKINELRHLPDEKILEILINEDPALKGGKLTDLMLTDYRRQIDFVRRNDNMAIDPLSDEEIMPTFDFLFSKCGMDPAKLKFDIEDRILMILSPMRFVGMYNKVAERLGCPKLELNEPPSYESIPGVDTRKMVFESTPESVAEIMPTMLEEVYRCINGYRKNPLTGMCIYKKAIKRKKSYCTRRTRRTKPYQPCKPGWVRSRKSNRCRLYTWAG